MKHMLINKQYLSLILVLIFSLSALLAQANPMTTKVTFNADDATLSSVLNSFSGTNIVLAVDQSGDQDKRDEKRVTINVKEVPIETAVSLVARTAGLSYRVVSGNTFVVGTKQNLAEEVGEKSYILYLNNLDAKKVPCLPTLWWQDRSSGRSGNAIMVMQTTRLLTKSLWCRYQHSETN